MKQVLSGSLAGSFVNIDESLLSRSPPMQVLVYSRLQNSDFPTVSCFIVQVDLDTITFLPQPPEFSGMCTTLTMGYSTPSNLL